MKEAGLGRRRITFDNKRSSHGKVRQVLETIFPKLKSQNGAFELLRAERGGTSCNLILIAMSEHGYSVDHLKEQVSSSTIIYIRPMQSNLPMTPVLTKTDDSIKTTCCKCKMQFPLGEMKQHLLECSEEGSYTANATHLLDDSSDVESLAKPSTSEITGYPDPEKEHVDLLQKGDWRRHLTELFPKHSALQTEVALREASSLEEAIENILANEPNEKEYSTSSNMNLSSLLEEFRKSNEKDEIEEIEVERDAVWVNILKYYKRNVSNPRALCKSLEVSFKGEEGLDGGAMKVEYFNLAWDHVTTRLFEGNPVSLVPIKDTTKRFLFQLTGILMVHTIMQSGPVNKFPRLSPSVVSCLLEESDEEIYSLLSKHDLPINASTENVHFLIEELDAAKTHEKVKRLFDDHPKCEAHWQIVNACHWPTTEQISLHNKHTFIQEIIYNEVIRSRKELVSEMKQGLQMLGFFPFLKKHPQQFRKLFCSLQKKFGPEDFKALIQETKTSSFTERQAWEWFLEFVNEGDLTVSKDDPEKRVVALLSFATGWQLPPTTEDFKIKLEFLPDDDCHTLPTSSACLRILRIPTVHSTKSKFKEAMLVALEHGRQGFPNP